MRHATIQCNVEHATTNRRACTAQHAPCRPERPTRMHHFSTTHGPEHTACAHCAFPRQLPCAIKVLCDTYTYVAAVWSVCSATCGAGVRTREVGCQARCRLLYRPPWTRARAWLNGSAPLRALRSIAIRWNPTARAHARACVPTAPPPACTCVCLPVTVCALAVCFSRSHSGACACAALLTVRARGMGRRDEARRG